MQMKVISASQRPPMMAVHHRLEAVEELIQPTEFMNWSV
jgi:hypothetical protein